MNWNGETRIFCITGNVFSGAGFHIRESARHFSRNQGASDPASRFLSRVTGKSGGLSHASYATRIAPDSFSRDRIRESSWGESFLYAGILSYATRMTPSFFSSALISSICFSEIFAGLGHSIGYHHRVIDYNILLYFISNSIEISQFFLDRGNRPWEGKAPFSGRNTHASPETHVAAACFPKNDLIRRSCFCL